MRFRIEKLFRRPLQKFRKPASCPGLLNFATVQLGRLRECTGIDRESTHFPSASSLVGQGQSVAKWSKNQKLLKSLTSPHKTALSQVSSATLSCTGQIIADPGHRSFIGRTGYLLFVEWIRSSLVRGGNCAGQHAISSLLAPNQTIHLPAPSSANNLRTSASLAGSPPLRTDSVFEVPVAGHLFRRTF